MNENVKNRIGLILIVGLLAGALVLHNMSSRKGVNTDDHIVENQENLIKLHGEAQGTKYDIRYIDSLHRNLKPEIEIELNKIDKALSTYRPDSEISRFNSKDSIHNPSEMMHDMLRMSQDVYLATNGLFDPTVSPLYKLWFDKEKNLKKIPSQKTIDSLLYYVGYNKIAFNEHEVTKSDPKIEINFNAIAQGYSSDLIARLLMSYGITNFKIDIGGEIVCHGHNAKDTPWRIAIEEPDTNSQGMIHSIVGLENKCIATSGSYRNFRRLGKKTITHTINPKTGQPMENNILSVSVIAESAAIADAYATAFMVMGIEGTKKFLEHRTDMQVYIIYRANSKIKIWKTVGFESYLLKDEK